MQEENLTSRSHYQEYGSTMVSFRGSSMSAFLCILTPAFASRVTME
jgi:hypothetical protein